MKQSGMDATVRRGSDGTVGVVGGRYESWFVSARDPAAARALWIRHTRLRTAGGRESVALWCTLFEPEPIAVKQSLASFPAGAHSGPDGFRGSAAAGGHAAEWELALTGAERPLRPLRPALLYRTPVPRTKTEAPLPDALSTGQVTFDGRRVEVAGWRATVGHNWGAEHAEHWVWLHADLDDGWLELVLARVRAGRVLSPWLGGGALALAGARRALGPRAHVDAAPGRLHARVGGVHAEIDVPLAHIVAFAYANPTGGPARESLHAGVCTVRLRVDGRVLTGAAAYELGGRESTGAVALQPYPDP
jgi:hypothetical protein